jgi:hypothetical protein
VEDQGPQDYVWTRELDTAFSLQFQGHAATKSTDAVLLIRKLTGWPWHVCRTQASRLGFLKPRIHHDWTPELDEILERGYRLCGGHKQKAIARIQAVTGWPRQACYDRARKLGLSQGRRRWTEGEDKYLLDFVGARNLRQIAKRLKRTVPAVRMRLGQLGTKRKLSARVTDGHTKSELAQYLHCGRRTIQHWIDRGWLKARYEGKNRVDDTLRITDEDFRAFCKKHPHEISPHRLPEDGLRWFCSVVFDVPPDENFGDPLDRRQRRLERKQQRLALEGEDLEPDDEITPF